MRPFSNLASVVYKRTYSRELPGGGKEKWADTVERAIAGNVRGHNVDTAEIDALRYFFLERKAMVAGRGLWCSGTDIHTRLGGAALNNCWFFTADNLEHFVVAQDLLMLGGGVGLSVEREFVSKLPKVKRNVVITHKNTKDADYIVPDSREGWCRLLRMVLSSFFEDGKSFSYSTVCLRPYGAKIHGFGGVASGGEPLIKMVEKICAILVSREGKVVRPIDAADILCCIGEMVVAGNVRRSAIIILGDSWDKDYLKAKRWDLGPIPTQRSKANFSIVAEDPEHDLRPLFWQTYHQGEAFGIVNRANIQKFGRIGDLKKDSAVGVNPCGEATLENGEPCNLVEQNLAALKSEKEFAKSSVLMNRYAQRVTCDPYHWKLNSDVVKRNRRIGVGITGCLMNPDLFNPKVLDSVYNEIQKENEKYAKELGIPRSIRTTVIKPSGTLSKLMDTPCEGIHPAYSKYAIQRVRFSTSDKIVSALQEAGHFTEPERRSDGSNDYDTTVVEFYIKAGEGVPLADEGFGTKEQLEAVKMAQRHWADQSISVTAYYDKNNIDQVKEWVTENLKELKTISFLAHSGHGFDQAPKEPITREEYEAAILKIKPVDISGVDGDLLDGLECEGGACPVR